MEMDLDAQALAALNFGADPNVGALILEEFFGGDDDRSRDRSQILADHLVPGVGGIPTTGLTLEVNPSAVTNLTRRFSQPTTLQFDPADVTGTVTGGVGLRGVMRFVGDFDGIFVMGDFLLVFDPARRTADGTRSGWTFVNYFDNFRVPAFDSRDVAVTVRAGSLEVSGAMTVSSELSNAFLPGNQGARVGTFTLRANLPGADFLPVETVAVGHAGNPADITGYGRVDYAYRIGLTEVTNAQYAFFLNAVDSAGVNPHELYNPNMSSEIAVSRGGIDFDPLAAAGAKYRPKPLHGNKPVSYVSFYDAARFTNWLMTGDTEHGFYVLDGLNSFASEGTHGPAYGGAYVALPNEDEWYKAAYHKNDGITGNYFLYPTASDDVPTVAESLPNGDISNPGANVANHDFGATWNGAEGLGNVTTVASAGPLSASPYGTYDQGGNQLEWNDTKVDARRGIRGGSLWLTAEDMRSTTRAGYFTDTGGSSLAFRIVCTDSLIPRESAKSLRLRDVSVSRSAEGVSEFQFFGEAGVEYRFDWTTDMVHWHRVHLPQTGTGGMQVIDLPITAREAPKCWLRAVMMRTSW